MTLYHVFLYIHIVCAVIWVGGAVAMQVLAIMASRSADKSDLPRVGRYAERIGTLVFLPAALLLFIAGVVMVIQSWNFGQVWVAVSVALWIVSALAGALYLGPTAKKVARLFETEGPESSSGLALLRRLFLVSRLELVSFAIIIAMMVFKPGS